MFELLKEYTGYDLQGKSKEELLSVCDKLDIEVDPKSTVSKLLDEIFSAKELTRDSTRIKICALSDVVLNKQTRNDCLDVVCTLYPEVAKVMAWLSDFAPTKLTGTGACVFARFNRKAQAEKVLSQLPMQWDGFVAQGVNHSPLYHDR